MNDAAVWIILAAVIFFLIDRRRVRKMLDEFSDFALFLGFVVIVVIFAKSCGASP